LSFENRYISSDSIDDDICRQLIQKYNLSIIDLDEVDTILFACTCHKFILSSGTYSWLIGFLSMCCSENPSIIYYPKIKKIWHGDIFVYPEWIEYEN
jgi:hypothetical protein